MCFVLDNPAQLQAILSVLSMFKIGMNYDVWQVRDIISIFDLPYSPLKMVYQNVTIW